MTLLFFLVLVLLSTLLRRKSSPRFALVLASTSLLSVTLVIATYPFHPQFTPGALEVNVLDVGQGLALGLGFLVPAGARADRHIPGQRTDRDGGDD